MGKKALVTGASGGIGYAFAHALAKDGYTITAVARSEEKLKKLTAELPSGDHRYKVADLSDPAHISQLADHISETKYDLLINNAGAGIYDWFAETEIAQHKRIMRLNIDAVTTLAHAFLARAREGDALVNVASILAFLPYAPAGVYAATKAFVLSLSEGLWYEQKGKGVYVMALCPGVTDSGFHEAAGGQPHEKPSAFLTQTADEVVSEALRALDRRKKPVIISGWKNRVGLFLTRFLSRKKLVSIVAKW